MMRPSLVVNNSRYTIYSKDYGSILSQKYSLRVSPPTLEAGIVLVVAVRDAPLSEVTVL